MPDPCSDEIGKFNQKIHKIAQFIAIYGTASKCERQVIDNIIDEAHRVMEIIAVRLNWKSTQKKIIEKSSFLYN